MYLVSLINPKSYMKISRSFMWIRRRDGKITQEDDYSVSLQTKLL